MQSRRDFSVIALLTAFALLGAAVLGTMLLFKRQQDAQRWVVHTLTVQNRLSMLIERLQEAEAGQRGYLITRDPRYLPPFFSARDRLSDDLASLRALVVDNPDQEARNDKLEPLARMRMAQMGFLVGLIGRGEQDRAVQVTSNGQGQRVMSKIRALVAEMRTEESRLYKQRADRSVWEARMVTAWLLLSAIAVAGLAFVVVRGAGRRARDAGAARDQLAAAHARLIDEVASREAAEAQVRQMHKMESIGQLTGGIAHDFNNMLAIVIGSLDLARRRLTSDPERAEHGIDQAMQGAERAAQLTSRLLAFSRQQPLAPRAVDANRLVGDMSELMRRTIGETIRFETVLAGGLWSALIDPAQLENALVNLCVNARDAMPDGGRLTIETTNTHLDEAYAAGHAEVTAGQYVMISVTDSGTGMPPEVIERAFDPFFTTKEVGRGTGLGLSQVYGFVKQSGGHVKIYSEAGVGTTVKLYLPRHFGAADAPAGQAASAELPRARDGEIVLVVEDEENVRLLSVDTLRDLGYLVVHANGPRQALDMLDSHGRIDLLFTDVIMPDMNGRKLADLVRAERPELKVLYTTGYTKNAIVHNGMLDHDVAFIAKPFTVAQLAAKVRQVLDAA